MNIPATTSDNTDGCLTLTNFSNITESFYTMAISQKTIPMHFYNTKKRKLF